MVRRPVAAVAALLLLPAATLRAQESATTDSAFRVGARAARAVIDPFPVSFTRGDSIAVRVSLVDSVGGELNGARWSLETDGGGVRFRLVDSTGTDRHYLFAGDAPGTQSFRISVQTAGVRGPETKALDSLTATVSDWAVSRVEIVNPDYTAYSGTTVQLRARVYSTHDTEIEDPKITWATDDPCHSRLMPDGAISFGAPSKITVTAKSQGKLATKALRIATNPVATVDLSPKSARTRVGDVLKFRVGASDSRGQDITDVALSYTVAAVDSGRGSARIDDRGFFVAEQPGNYVVRVSAGDVMTEALVEVARRPAPTPVQLVGRGQTKGTGMRALAVFGGKDGRDYAYTGTDRGRLHVWDVTDPAHIALSDSLTLDAAIVGDVKVSADAAWAVVGRSGGFGARNGITVLDLATPAHPRVMAEMSDNLAGGIESAWISGNMVYAVNVTAGALDIVDLSTPAQPHYVGRWETRVGQSKVLHDVWGDQKNLYLAYGGDGLVILDIGDAGTPTNPKLVSQLKWRGAAAHSVVRAGRYAYVGEDISGCAECVNGPRGAVRIIDVTKIKEPSQVGRYEVPEAGADRLTIESSTMFVGFRQGGVRIVDVTGELRGDIYREGRQVGWFMTSTPEGAAMASSAVSFKGLLFVADANSGLWVLRHQRAARLTP